MTEKGVVLVGEAAKSWVLLQWIDSIQIWIIVWGIILGIGFLIYCIAKEDLQKEKKE